MSARRILEQHEAFSLCSLFTLAYAQTYEYMIQGPDDDSWCAAFDAAAEELDAIYRFLGMPESNFPSLKQLPKELGLYRSASLSHHITQLTASLRGDLPPQIERLLKAVIFSGATVHYGARGRLAVRILCRWAAIADATLFALERSLAHDLLDLAARADEDQNHAVGVKESPKSRLFAGLAVGAAALGGGALLAVTGGLAAPAIAAGLGTLLSAAGLTTAAGVLSSSAVALTATSTVGFGLYGANDTANKMARRVGGVRHVYLKEIPETPLPPVSLPARFAEAMRPGFKDIPVPGVKLVSKMLPASKPVFGPGEGHRHSHSHSHGHGHGRTKSASLVTEVGSKAPAAPSQKSRSPFDALAGILGLGKDSDDALVSQSPPPPRPASVPPVLTLPPPSPAPPTVSEEGSRGTAAEMPAAPMETETSEASRAIALALLDSLRRPTPTEPPAPPPAPNISGQRHAMDKDTDPVPFDLTHVTESESESEGESEEEAAAATARVTLRDVPEPAPSPSLSPTSPDETVTPRRPRLAVTVCVSGWAWDPLQFLQPWQSLVQRSPGSECLALVWEERPVIALGNTIIDFVRSKIYSEIAAFLVRDLFDSFLSAIALPLKVLRWTNVIDSTWAIVARRAEKAGIVLGRLLASGALGDRPATLLGFSFGASVAFHALLELDRMGVRDRVENVILLGAPLSTDEALWTRARGAVAGRLVNAYSRHDLLLALVYRAKSLAFTAAGIQPVGVPGVEDVNVSRVVGGHTDYVEKMDEILEAVNA